MGKFVAIDSADVKVDKGGYLKEVSRRLQCKNIVYKNIELSKIN